MSRGELHVSIWCRRTKNDRLRKEKKRRERNLIKVDRYLQGKRGVPTTGKFRLVAGNTIRAKACYNFIVDKDLITELRLPRVKIPFKPIIGFIKENTKEPWVEIIEIIKFSIDI